MYYIGLDIHKKDTQACVLNEKGKFVHGERLRTNVHDIGHLFEKMERMKGKDDDLSVVIEAMDLYLWIYDVIVGRGHQAKVVHPNRAKALMKARSKTDRNDALMLAQLLRLGGLDGTYVPSVEIRELRDLTRHRESLVRKKGDLNREAIGALDQHGTKVPAEFKTNLSNKFNGYVRGLGVLIINEKLDLLDLFLKRLVDVQEIVDLSQMQRPQPVLMFFGKW
jgi:transposase